MKAEATVDALAPAMPAMDALNDTNPIRGSAEAGSTVTVTFPDGSTVTTTAGPDGKFTVHNPGDLEDGQTIIVTATDVAGNTSAPAHVVIDAVAPNAPTVETIVGDNDIVGEAEPGSTVTVTYPDGSTANTLADENGHFTHNPGLNPGEKVTVSATDAAGNVSPPTEAYMVPEDQLAPESPVVNPVNGTDPVTGLAEPGSEVTVHFPDGKQETVIAGADGSFSVPNPGLPDGSELLVFASDAAGNHSDPVTVHVDARAPDAPVIDPVNGSDSITGKGEPGAEITVTFLVGSKDKVTAGPDGSFTIHNPGQFE